MRSASNLAISQGAYAEARELGETALEVAREAGDEGILARALNTAANAANGMGEFDRGEALLTEGLELVRRLGDELGEAQVLSNLGEVARYCGDLETAKLYHEQALGIDRRMGEVQHLVVSLLNLGLVERQRANAPGALRHYREALTTAQAVQDREGMAYALAGLAGLTGEAGDVLHVARWLGAAETVLETIGAAMQESERELADGDAAAARAVLGEEAFSAAWTAGRAMTWEAAVAEALVVAGTLTAETADA